MKALSALIAFVLFFLVYPLFSPVYAVTVSITNFPSVISDSPFTLTASISGASAGTNYLRIDIFKDGTTNYFGETYNGSDFFGGSTYTQYLPITIQASTSWIGDIQARAGTPSNSQYDSTGTYKIRIRRYTSGGGNTASEANNSAVTVTIDIPTPTPIPTPSPTEAPANTPTSTLKPTATSTSIKLSPTPTKKVSPTPAKKISSSPVLKTANSKSSSPGVLGAKIKSAPTKTPKSDKILVQSASNNTLLPLILIGIGVVFFFLCVIVFFYPAIKEKFNKNEQ